MAGGVNLLVLLSGTGSSPGGVFTISKNKIRKPISDVHLPVLSRTSSPRETIANLRINKYSHWTKQN